MTVYVLIRAEQRLAPVIYGIRLLTRVSKTLLIPPHLQASRISILELQLRSETQCTFPGMVIPSSWADSKIKQSSLGSLHCQQAEGRLEKPSLGQEQYKLQLERRAEKKILQLDIFEWDCILF